MSNAVARKLAAYREVNCIKQADLSNAMGFKDRQTLSSIENGERTIKPDELIDALKFMGVTMQDFIDPTSLVGRAKFSWRQQEATDTELNDTEYRVSKVIGLFEHVSKSNDTTTPFLLKLPLNKNSTIADAQEYAEKVVSHLKLGEYPAKNLMSKVSELGIHTLYLDLNNKVSAAAVNVTKGSYIIVNRMEVPGRRNFNYAHELFHIFTWDALPPKHSEQAYSVKAGKKPIEEKLADAFTEALLMPKASILSKVSKAKGAIDEVFINHLANTFEVSALAMKFRLFRLKLITQTQLDALDDNALRFNGEEASFEPPRLFNEFFVNALQKSLYQGSVSARKASDNLDMSFSEINRVMADYHLKPAIEL